MIVTTHFKNEFDSQGQLFMKFLNYCQFAVCLSFFVLAIKTLFVKDWDFFFLNSAFMILFGLLALKGFKRFKLKDYYSMRDNFFRETGLLDTDFNFSGEDDIFQNARVGRERRVDSDFNPQLQKSVLKKFHCLYTDSVVKEVIARSKRQFMINTEERQTQLSFNSEARKISIHQSGDTARKSSKEKGHNDSLWKIIADKNVSVLGKNYMNTCGLDISYGSVEDFGSDKLHTAENIKKRVNSGNN